jgi:sortase A
MGRFTALVKREWRSALAVLASFLVVAIGFQYFTSPEPSGTPKVTKILDDIDKDKGGTEDDKKDKVDDPTGAAIPEQKLSIKLMRGKRSPIGVLRVPAIDLKTPFYDGVFDAIVELGPGHWPGTPLPGEKGNSVFAGHRTTFTAPFGDLDLVDKGDKVFTRINNKTTTYKVYKMAVVPEAEYVDFVLKQPTKPNAKLITLFACTPKGQRTHRIVVQAKAAGAGEQSPSQRSRGDAPEQI